MLKNCEKMLKKYFRYPESKFSGAVRNYQAHSRAKNAPCVFNNWANFYKGKFVSNTILNANAFEKLLK